MIRLWLRRNYGEKDQSRASPHWQYRMAAKFCRLHPRRKRPKVMKVFITWEEMQCCFCTTQTIW